jgi:type I restriction enzyme R subunit
VDKNMKYHGLVQAFSRTNRIYNEKKKHGNIVCFRNLKNNTDTAIRLFSDEDALDVVLMRPYEEYLRQFNDFIETLLAKYPTISSIDELEGDEAKKGFIVLFRNILRLKTRLRTFYQFTFDDLDINEQQLEDYTGKYKDLYPNGDGDIEKASILDDIDFEIELLKRDDINMDYILELLKNLEPGTPGYVKDKQSILNILNSSIELKSKKELIEKFMNEVLVSNEQDIIGDFEVFISREKQKELMKFSEQENLDYEKILKYISEYEFTGLFDETILEESFKENMGLLKRRAKKKDLLTKIREFIEKFSF